MYATEDNLSIIIHRARRRRKRRSWNSIAAAAVGGLFAACYSSNAFVIIPSRSVQQQSRLCSYPPNLLEELTVKELRQLLKENKLHEQERGLLSRLKRKQDLVDYLAENLPSNGSSSEQLEENGVAVISEEADLPKRTRPLQMPPIAVVEVPPTDETAVNGGEQSPKDILFEQLYERYPPLRPVNGEQHIVVREDDMDVRQRYHPMLRNLTKSDMDIVFVGTASCTPGVTRGVSCTALRLNWRRRALPVDGQQKTTAPEYSGFAGGTWLFDVGECTQLQAQRTSNIKPGKITKIFITHAHGDHSFGLPGLLCLMGQDRDRDAPPVDIYGPEGLRKWLRVAIRYSVSRIVPPYRVHEIMDIPMAPEWELHRRTGRYFYKGRRKNERWGSKGLAGEDRDSWITQCNHINLPPSSQFGEISGGRDIFPIYDHPLSHDGAPVWEVEDEDDVKVYAAPMSHGVPCLGYVVDEQSRPGRLRNEYVEPIVRRNLDALKEAGFNIPMKAMAVIKNLPEGSSFSFPDGTVVTQEEAVEPARSGRKVVICGDTADARSLIKLAQDADVLVHEATNTYLPGVDKDTDLRAVTKDTIIHGHSTPHMAGEFAKKINAKRLLLNHFSARYKGDDAIDSISLMTRIEMQALKTSSLDESCVASAWDLMLLSVPQN